MTSFPAAGKFARAKRIEVPTENLSWISKICVAEYVMPNRSSKTNPDLNQRAKVSADHSAADEAPVKNPAAVALGRLGGLKGGKARAAKLSPEERVRIAQSAAAKRWSAKSSSSSSKSSSSEEVG